MIFQKLGTFSEENKNYFGGKARSLDLMIKNNLPVPKGFVVSIENLSQLITSQFTEILKSELLSLGGKKVIVRSSFEHEDGHSHSFAGLFESEVCENNFDQVVAAIENCLRASNSDKVIQYLNHFNLKSGRCSLIVQKLIEPEFSGVLFRNEDSNSPVQAHIEFVLGHCEKLVQGTVTPYQAQILNGKTVLLTMGDEGQSEVLHHWEKIRSELENLFLVVNMNLDSHYSDIEWVYDKNGLNLVQARPTTQNIFNDFLSLKKDLPKNLGLESDVFSDVNLSENYPRPLSPLLFSIAQVSYPNYFRHLARTLGVSEEQIEKHDRIFNETVSCFDGRIFYNMTKIHSLITLLPFSSHLSNYFNQFIGFDFENSHDYSSSKKWLPFLNFGSRFLFAVLRMQKRLDGFEKETVEFLSKCRSGELTMKQRFQGFLDIRFKRWRSPAICDFSAMVSYGLSNALLKKWAPDYHAQGGLSKLLTGLSDLVSTQTSVDLSELAFQVRQDQQIFEFWKDKSSSQIITEMKTNTNWSLVRDTFEKYLENWGFRCSEELMLTTPNLQENPHELVQIVKTYLHHPQVSGRELLVIQKEKALAESKKLSKDLGFSLRLIIFKVVWIWTCQSIRAREQARTNQARLYAELRRTCLDLGNTLHKVGVILLPEDIFYFTFQEIETLLARGNYCPEATWKWIAFARKDAEKKLSSRPQTRFRMEENQISVDDHQRLKLDPSFQFQSFYKGQSASSGSITGKVVVLTSSQQIGQIKKGDILVTPQTDPGWGPVFPLISGLIIENGGLLSHGAILAREFGIPSLVGLSGITHRLKSGDRVELNADDGYLKILTKDFEAATSSQENHQQV